MINRKASNIPVFLRAFANSVSGPNDSIHHDNPMRIDGLLDLERGFWSMFTYFGSNKKSSNIPPLLRAFADSVSGPGDSLHHSDPMRFD